MLPTYFALLRVVISSPLVILIVTVKVRYITKVLLTLMLKCQSQ